MIKGYNRYLRKNGIEFKEILDHKQTTLHLINAKQIFYLNEKLLHSLAPNIFIAFYN